MSSMFIFLPEIENFYSFSRAIGLLMLCIILQLENRNKNILNDFSTSEF